MHIYSDDNLRYALSTTFEYISVIARWFRWLVPKIAV